MALQYNLIMESGIVVNAAYATITNIYTQHIQTRNIHNINVEVYNNLSSYNDGKPPVTTISISRAFDPNDTVSFNDLYTYLKTLPEFTGATDV